MAVDVGMKRLRMEEGSGEVGSADVAANVLVLFSRGAGGEGPRHPGRLFRCKSCARQFPSFQALGGHRASHKRPRLGDANDQAQQHAAAPAKPRAHECPICGLEFAMGQALGGHMRRHRAAAGAFPLVFVEKKHGVGGGGGGGKRRVVSLDLDLDLNLSLPSSDEDEDLCALKLGLGLPVVGCLY